MLTSPDTPEASPVDKLNEPDTTDTAPEAPPALKPEVKDIEPPTPADAEPPLIFTELPDKSNKPPAPKVEAPAEIDTEPPRETPEPSPAAIDTDPPVCLASEPAFKERADPDPLEIDTESSLDDNDIDPPEISIEPDFLSPVDTVDMPILPFERMLMLLLLSPNTDASDTNSIPPLEMARIEPDSSLPLPDWRTTEPPLAPLPPAIITDPPTVAASPILTEKSPELLSEEATSNLIDPPLLEAIKTSPSATSSAGFTTN